ncbi:hypothetical protein SH580_14015 [Coraliomargarita algicola]|uniref:Uncharacterized protein n=1 Tax=Coraliomargarita algicola TaxID=3092156 RepID=A0ABZ0RGK4_9BACT|nr:hypothetical protein [Coraliomargarita sp. J2-16]WPJ94546.1 hypothetical protein SH580_14015 [Coraliomargarita sp. J2-16]
MNFIRSLFSLWWFPLFLFVASGITILNLFWFIWASPGAEFLSQEEGKTLTAEAKFISFLGGVAGFTLYWRMKGSFTLIDNTFCRRE